MLNAYIPQASQKNKLPSLQQINSLLLKIVNSIYLDKADAIINVPSLDSGENINFRFRDGREIYDAQISADNRLSYVEFNIRSDAYLEGVYLHGVIPSSQPSNYVNALLDSRISRHDAKRRRCQRGKTCGGTCIEKGDVCDRPLNPQAGAATEKIRNAFSQRNVLLGLGVTAAGLAVAGIAANNKGNKPQSSSPQAPPPKSPTPQSSSPQSPTSAPRKSAFYKSEKAEENWLNLKAGLMEADEKLWTNRDLLEELYRKNSSNTLGSMLSTAFGYKPVKQELEEINQLIKASRDNPNEVSRFRGLKRKIADVVSGRSLFSSQKSSNQVSSSSSLLLNPSNNSRVAPRSVEVIATRAATQDEIEQFSPRTRSNLPQPRREYLSTLPSSGETFVTDPRRQKVDGVLNAVAIEGFDEQSEARLKNVLSRIDRTVNLTNLPPIKVQSMADDDPLISKAEGVYHHSAYFDKSTKKLIDRIPRSISLNTTRESKTSPELTLIHEVGHYLDHAAIGNTKELFSTSPVTEDSKMGKTSPVFNEFLLAAEKAPTTQKLLKRLNSAKTPEVREHTRYLLDRTEVFARAFTQYVATKSGSGVLQAQLKAARSVEKDKYWTDKEFKSIEVAMDKMFKELKWR